MTKYYVIPLMESGILIPCGRGKNLPISEYVERYYPKLAQLESERISIIYSGDYNAPWTIKQKVQLQNNALLKKQVANELGIPLHILAMNEGEKTYEVGTHSKIRSSSQVFLDFREQPRNVFLTYYNGDYIERVKRFMKRKDFTVIQGGAQKVIKK
ncbi:MAG: hypothetical protein K2I72_03215 [Bacilli bacterium]|nr:hypothetical protein [Bacilli bacterium]